MQIANYSTVMIWIQHLLWGLTRACTFYTVSGLVTQYVFTSTNERRKGAIKCNGSGQEATVHNKSTRCMSWIPVWEVVQILHKYPISATSTRPCIAITPKSPFEGYGACRDSVPLTSSAEDVLISFSRSTCHVGCCMCTFLCLVHLWIEGQWPRSVL